MFDLKRSGRISLTILLLSVALVTSNAQCETWRGLAEEDSLINAYVIYNDFLVRNEYVQAYDRWLHVYKNAPAVDGRRASVYSGGVLLHVGLARQAF